MTVPILTIAGAVAGLVCPALFITMMIGPEWTYYWHYALICGSYLTGLALGVGATLALSSRIWLRLVLAPVLGTGGITVVFLILTFALSEHPADRGLPLGEMLSYATYLGPHGGFLLTLAHVVFLIWRARFKFIVWIPLYAAAGSLAVLPAIFGPLIIPSPRGLALVGLMGLALGGLQLVAMRVCLAIEEKIGRRLTVDS